MSRAVHINLHQLLNIDFAFFICLIVPLSAVDVAFYKFTVQSPRSRKLRSTNGNIGIDKVI